MILAVVVPETHDTHDETSRHHETTTTQLKELTSRRKDLFSSRIEVKERKNAFKIKITKKGFSSKCALSIKANVVVDDY